MFSLYDRYQCAERIRLKFCRRISLAGCNSGIVPAMLKQVLDLNDSPPLGWQLPIAGEYHKRNQSVIIDMKPNNGAEIVLCELDKVFGFSHPGWSPIMFRLAQMYNQNVDDDDMDFDKQDFVCPPDDELEIIYTMSYLKGSFKEGKLDGTWVFPGRSSTNGLMLWPDAMTFFCEQIEKCDPGFLDKKTNFIKSQVR